MCVCLCFFLGGGEVGGGAEMGLEGMLMGIGMALVCW